MKFPQTENSIRSESATSEVRDSLKIYLREISKYPLMTREEEREMAQRVWMGGDREAGQKMVLANLRLVVRMALDCHSHLNLLDLIQEGNMGLVHAVRKYDPEKGTRFSTYASFWIRAYMLKYMMDTWSMVKVGTTDSERKLFFSLRGGPAHGYDRERRGHRGNSDHGRPKDLRIRNRRIGRSAFPGGRTTGDKEDE